MTHPNIEVKLIDPIANFDEATELFKENWKASGQSFDCNIADTKSFYTHLADQGAVFAAGAYFHDQLVGYCIVTILPHPLNHSVKICNVNGIYLMPEFRRGRVFAKIRTVIKNLATEQGAHLIHWHAPEGSEFSKALASRFTPVCNYYMEEVAPIERCIPQMSEESVNQARDIENTILGMPQISIATDHILHAGTYTRTILIPKGAVITGALIKRSVNLVICGHVIVFIGDDKVREYKGYVVIPAMAHRKQVFIAKEDTSLTMFFATNAQSIEEAEEEFTDEVDLLGSRLPHNINNIIITGE